MFNISKQYLHMSLLIYHKFIKLNNILNNSPTIAKSISNLKKIRYLNVLLNTYTYSKLQYEKFNICKKKLDINIFFIIFLI